MKAKHSGGERHVVKRRGHKERFDERKVYASCYAACLSSHLHHRDAEKVAARVTARIRQWIDGKPLVTADDLFQEVGKHLAALNRDAAYMYRTHRDVS
ncbi:MAG: hypothetical protein HY520_02250 [Candidatus Aenigmarchaeota archaeon]|nr:hypothetical protein [Candidatus Aenigmarchaeota archaeon]